MIVSLYALCDEVATCPLAQCQLGWALVTPADNFFEVYPSVSAVFHRPVRLYAKGHDRAVSVSVSSGC